MASDIAIAVEGLSKCYRVGHQAQREAHPTLRDQIVRHARNLARKTRDMASGKVMVQGDTVEDFWALRDVSFEIPRGARVGILGRNGAGKSTLLKLLSRITEPTSGRIKINGRVASLLEVGTGFHPELSGRENIFLNGAILGMSRREIQGKFDEIVAFAEVERFLDTPVKRYSSGMYVRLAFAVAAHLDPEIMIVDEVLAVGDAKFQSKCIGKMKEVGKEGRTVLFVSHNVGAIRQLCETALYLQEGTVIDYTTVDIAVAHYMNEGTKDGGLHVWDQGFGQNLLLHKVEITSNEGERRTEFTGHEAIVVRLLVSSTKPIAGARLGFRISSLDGNVIFASEDADSLTQGAADVVGFAMFHAVIPGGLLNDGVYLITVAAHVPNIQVLFLAENIIRFKVLDVTEYAFTARVRRPGFILPMLSWTRE